MNKKLLALAVTGLLCATGVSAHDFEVDGIYYNITSEEDKTVEVTYQGDSYSAIEEYSGAVSIPATITYDGQEYSVTSIGFAAFSGCNGLTSLEIPNSVTSIGFAAFSDCDGLTSLEIPNSVTNIEGGAFMRLRNLNSIVVAEDNPVYDSREECNAIIESSSNTLIAGFATTIIPNIVTSIGNRAFYYCDGLTTVDIPNSVTCIGDEAFMGCFSLTSVEIPNSVVNIGGSVFVLNSNLSSLVVAADNPVYDSREGCNAIIESSSNTLIIGCSSTTIPNSVTCIGREAFVCCYELTSVNIPYGVTSIEDGAFGSCTGLTFLDIPNSVTNIGYGAFVGCHNLSTVVIPNSVTCIEDEAFWGCSGLTTITSNISADKLFSISESVFDGVDKINCTLNVPYGAQTAYAYTEGWEDFENIVEMDPPSFDLTVSSAGYATLYLDYTAQIPEGVSVYTANEVEGNLLKMELVEGLLPANTGVVVKAPAGTYTFTYSDAYAPEISDNLFKGSATYEYVDVASTQTAFVLSKVDGEVGMYPAKLTDGRFLNNANKAYLLLTTKLGVSDEELDTSVGGSQLSLRFDFGGTTGVDKVQTESGADAVIYDLYGRKVNKATTPGFYIINNKKVWVK